MDRQTVLAKTTLGVEALNQRSADLPRVLRHALILVDGRSNLAELEARGAIVPDFSGALVELITRGLVAERGGPSAATKPAARTPDDAGAVDTPQSPREALAALATRLLGMRGDKVLRKIREAGTSRDELLAASDACFKLIRLTIDEKLADEFRRQARQLLGSGG
jgi:hypothetical protein